MTDLLEFKMFMLYQYINTPLLDKIESPKDLPEHIGNYLKFDMQLNLKYSQL